MTNPEELKELIRNIAADHLNLEEGDASGSVTLPVDKVYDALNAAYEAGEQYQQRDTIESTLLFWQLMESLPDHVYFKDLNSRFTCINHSLARFFGLSHPDEAIGHSDFDYFKETFARAKFEAEQEIIRTGQGWTFREERDLQADGTEKWVVTTKLPLRDLGGDICGTFGLSRDITDQKRAELALERQRKLLETIIRILPCRIYVRDMEGRFLLINDEYRRVFGLDTREEVIGKRLSDLRDNRKAREIEREDRHIMETGEIIQNQLEFDQRLLGINRWVLTSKVPLIGPDGKSEGIVGMTLDISEQKEAENRAQSANEALSLKNKQFEAELLVARQLQEQLMSMGFDHRRRFTRQGQSWNIEASYLYKPSHHLAGDFFYLIPIDSDHYGILVCDVMGHGVKAALVTMLIRGLMLETPTLLRKPGELLSHLNQNLVDLAEDEEFPRFVTAVYSLIDLKKGTVILASAGHPTPLCSAHDEAGDRFDPCPIKSIGPALGLISGEAFEQSDFQLSTVTELLFFTDGIIEQKTSDNEEFGRLGLEKSILEHESDDLPAQLDSLSQDLQQSANSDRFGDDICIIAVRLSPRSPS